MILTREAITKRRDSIWESLLQLQGAFDCLTELLEAEAQEEEKEVDDELA